MITAGTIYWLTRLDYVSFPLITFSVITGLLFFTFLVIRMLAAIDNDRLSKNFRRLHGIIGIVFAVFLLGAILTPSSKEVAAMYVIPKVANNETVQEFGDQVKTLAIEWLEELRPEQKKILRENKE